MNESVQPFSGRLVLGAVLLALLANGRLQAL